MNKDQDNIFAGDPPPKQQRLAEDDDDPLLDIAHLSSSPPHIALRFAFSAVGAFLLGVFPGVILVYHIATHSRLSLGISDIVVLHVFFATTGSFCGIALFRLLSWTKPTVADLAFVFGIGMLLGLIGFLYLVSLVPGT